MRNPAGWWAVRKRQEATTLAKRKTGVEFRRLSWLGMPASVRDAGAWLMWSRPRPKVERYDTG